MQFKISSKPVLINFILHLIVILVMRKNNNLNKKRFD